MGIHFIRHPNKLEVDAHSDDMEKIGKLEKSTPDNNEKSYPELPTPIRPIIKAVPPSKRASNQHDRRQIQPSLNKCMNIDNAHLPKEITEIIATRRRQERGWHLVFQSAQAFTATLIALFQSIKRMLKEKRLSISECTFGKQSHA
ncbi:hypothetical protein EPUL_001255 [Erysiphe pulchra]|uniref:Uncharacterized protein n=1 Tax=Erysiphe pulchra TaxID=225359 RepID=A0A2S4PYP9_9PEZI|nr:hypothetical protein EPUL_001255 [Erysiphe pulchra]